MRSSIGAHDAVRRLQCHGSQLTAHRSGRSLCGYRLASPQGLASLFLLTRTPFSSGDEAEENYVRKYDDFTVGGASLGCFWSF
jgi:hypothetical protein